VVNSGGIIPWGKLEVNSLKLEAVDKEKAREVAGF